jgi:hypothetical protein
MSSICKYILLKEKRKKRSPIRALGRKEYEHENSRMWRVEISKGV